MPAPLLKVSVETAADVDQIVADLLAEVFSQPAFVHTDLRKGNTGAAVYLDNPKQWTLPKRRQIEAALALLEAAGRDVGPARVRVERIRRVNWAQSWKHHFPSFVVGRTLLVRPSWSRRRLRKGQALVVLDPGLSFGTGQHPTTRFCLQQLVAGRQPGTSQSFLDAGTGSGILAIAAAKLGYRPVLGFDLDPDAVRQARANARRNRLAHRVRFRQQDLADTTAPPRGYALVCANLLTNLLLSQRKRLLQSVAPGGRLVLAGILRREFPRVRAAYEAGGCSLMRSEYRGEWASGLFCRKRLSQGG